MAKFSRGLLLAEVLLLSVEHTWAQNGPYKYCCDIQKCHNITATCTQIPACAAACLVAADADPDAGANTTTTASLPAACNQAWSLPGQDYSCFAEFMSPDTSLIERVCGQSYAPGRQPAPDSFISFGECRQSCGGWDLATSSTSTGPVALLMQYIVPVVVFCWTIPRRRKWDAPEWMFGSGRYTILKPPTFILSFLLSGVVVTLDMSTWIFTTFIAAGPILVGGVMELVLDFKILQHMEDGDSVSRHARCPEKGVAKPRERLAPNERIELMVAVLCGNLDDTIGDPKQRIAGALRLSAHHEGEAKERKLQSTRAYLASMLRSQGSFGSLVGTPVLFFVGSFIVALGSLSDSIGDNSTAHSLAFGMWWMVIVQVTIVSSCILASNNPSTVSGIVGDYRAPDTHSRIGQLRYLGMTPMYESVFMPVTLWDRGRMKKRWLQSTAAWQTRPWLRERLEIRPVMGLVLIPLAAFLLVLIPSTLAFLVSYTTPKICLVLIAANTSRSFYADSLRDAPASTKPTGAQGYLQKHQRIFANAGAAVGILLVALALSGALFTAFAGTVLELLGVYGNCICSIPAGKWLSPARDAVLINLATDTLLHRQMSVYWSAAGYAAIGFVMTMTYLGWWYQRALRRRFEGEISRLGT